MARSRNIKPGLFKNEILGEADPIYSLLFAGLWLLADREGRLENRPKRIRAEIFPYRFDVDVCKGLAWLMHESFITMYESGGVELIQVNNWSKHQNPHHKEVDSVLPPPLSAGVKEKSQSKHGAAHAQVMHEPCMNHARSKEVASSPLIPDSLNLIPDPLNPSKGSVDPNASRPLLESPNFLDFKSRYPKRAGSQPWARAAKAIQARLKEGHTWDEILNGVNRYTGFCVATGKVGRETVLQAATFCGPDKFFLDDFSPPPGPSGRGGQGNKQEAQEQRNHAAGDVWLNQQPGEGHA